MSLSSKSTLYLVVYSPIWDNTPHWALKVVSDTSSPCYLQIFGEPGTFAFNEVNGHEPVAACRRKDVKIWDLSTSKDVDRVKAAARNMRIDTETVLWNCQDWCLDIVQELEDEYVVGVEDDGDEEDLIKWNELKRKLKRERLVRSLVHDAEDHVSLE